MPGSGQIWKGRQAGQTDEIDYKDTWVGRRMDNCIDRHVGKRDRHVDKREETHRGRQIKRQG